MLLSCQGSGALATVYRNDSLRHRRHWALQTSHLTQAQAEVVLNPTLLFLIVTDREYFPSQEIPIFK